MEQWKDIPGYKGRYQASTAGRVRSLDREVFVDERKSKRGSFMRKCRGRILRPGPHSSGHLSVALGLGCSKMVHQLVLLTFVGPVPDGRETLHKNHKPTDNRLTNLKYGTRSENLKMDYAAGGRTAKRRAIVGTRISDGKTVNFSSVHAAARALVPNKKSNWSIWCCCQGRASVAYGHTWRYA